MVASIIFVLYLILSPTSDEGQPLIAGLYCVLPLETVQVGFAEQPKVDLWMFMKNFTKD